MKIAIDIDRTLTEAPDVYEFPICEMWLSMMGIDYKKTDYFQLNAKDAFGLSEKVFKDWLDEFFPMNVKTAPVRRGAVLTLRMLKRLGNEIHIVTRRDPNYKGAYTGQMMKNDTYEWFSKNGLVYDEIHFGCKDKPSVCKEIGVDVMIEDEFLNIMPLAKDGIPCIVIKTKYNCPPPKEIVNSPYIIYKKNWDEIRDFLLKLDLVLNI